MHWPGAGLPAVGQGDAVLLDQSQVLHHQLHLHSEGFPGSFLVFMWHRAERGDFDKSHACFANFVQGFAFPARQLCLPWRLITSS